MGEYFDRLFDHFLFHVEHACAHEMYTIPAIKLPNTFARLPVLYAFRLPFIPCSLPQTFVSLALGCDTVDALPCGF